MHPEWPTFMPGEMVVLKDFRFEVVEIQGGLVVLAPLGPTGELVRRIARNVDPDDVKS